MTTVPQSKPKRRFARPALPVLIAAVLVIALLITLVARSLVGRAADPLESGTPATVTRGELVASVSATGAIEPVETADLAFASATGRVERVLVAAGDTVAQDAALVQLETRRLAAAAAAAEAGLAQAQADLQALTDGATPEQIAAARAQVEAARGALVQTQGSVTAADLRAAQASVVEAREKLARLEAGPKSDALTRAQSTLAEARARLDQQRTTLAATKVEAERMVAQRANTLREAQSAFSSAYWDLEYVKSRGQDPRTTRDLTDAEVQDFVNSYEQAQRNIANAEAQLAQAQVDYNTAKQAELTGLAEAQAQLATAQADLDELLTGSDADELAGARAQLAQAEANLAKLQGTQRQGALEAQQANLDSTQAKLDELLADPTASSLARAEAQVSQARAQLDQARAELDETTLRAPFAGVVAAVNVAPGEALGTQSPVTLFDVSSYLVKVTVDEVDVARVAVGQQADVLIDALGAPALTGSVRSIAPKASTDSTITAYEVTVVVDPAERPVKPGMTASATIISERRASALSVPAEALRSENGVTVVDLLTPAADGKLQTSTQAVQTGLRTSERVEIVGGLNEGQQVLIPNP